MPIIIPPNIVQESLNEFLAPLFKNEPQRTHLAHYLTGLMIAENKTITGIANAVLANMSLTPPINPVSIAFSQKSNGT